MDHVKYRKGGSTWYSKITENLGRDRARKEVQRLTIDRKGGRKEAETLVAERRKNKGIFPNRFYFLCEGGGKVICRELGGEGWMPEKQWL